MPTGVSSLIILFVFVSFTDVLRLCSDWPDHRLMCGLYTYYDPLMINPHNFPSRFPFRYPVPPAFDPRRQLTHIHCDCGESHDF